MVVSAELLSSMNYGKRKALSMHSSGRSSPRTLGDFEEFEGDGERDNNKRKTRNLSEKRRRDQFNMLINELFSMVSTTNRKMDKTTVLKATIAFLRSQNDVVKQCQAHEIKENWKPSFLSNDEFAQLMLEALDGFLLVITQSGTILYASESVTSLLNHLPSDLVNRSMYDFIHLDERMKFYNILSSHKVVGGTGDIADYEKDENQLTFTCHWRCGTVAVSDSPVYELVEIQGTFRKLDTDGSILMSKDDNMQSDACSSSPEVCFCCTVRLKCSQVIRELSFVDESKKEFTSRHSMEWKFLFLDHRGPTIIGYLPFEVLGTSGYDYYHPNDLHKVAKGHEQLMQTGKGTSCYYRFLTKGQQWIWLQTTYYITYHQWNSKPEFIVCTNTVVNYAEVRADIRGQHGFVLDLENKQSGVQDSAGGEQDGPSSSSFWLQPSQSRTPSTTAPTKAGESDMADTTEGSPTKVRCVQRQPSHDMKAEAVAVQPVQSSSVAIAKVSEPTVSSPSTSVLYLTPAQRQLQQQLEQKHTELQQAIIRQQEELRSISEQLVLVSHLAGGSLPSPQPMELGMAQPILTQPLMASTAVLQGNTSNIMVTSQMPQINMSQNLQQVMSIPMMMLQQQPVLLSNQPVITTQHVQHTQQMQQSSQQIHSQQQQQQQQPPNHN